MPHQCHDEHCTHDHSSDIVPAQQSLLYAQIDFSGVRVLNEVESGSGRAVLQKAWDARLTSSPVLESDADEQLLVHVPFAGQVRLHSVLLRSEDGDAAPKSVRLFANAEDLDFDAAADAKPTQTLELASTSVVQDIGVKRALFNTTRSLTLFFPDNWGAADQTRIAWIAFKGDFMRLSREPVEVLYESAARPSDHKVEGTNESVGGMGFGGLGGGGRQGF